MLGRVRGALVGQVMLLFLLVTLVLNLLCHLTTLPVRREVAVLAGMVGQRVIVIDPGHGGFDGGAQGPSGVTEEEVVLGVAQYLAQYLKQVGGRVFLTREKDEELAEDEVDDLNARIRMASEVDADIFISIHANSFPSPYEFGAQTFFCHNVPGSEDLAQEIQRALVEGISVLGYNYREVQVAEYYILRNLEIPAVLVEVGFLSNPREEILLSKPAYRQRLAWCIFVGIVRYFAGSGQGRKWKAKSEYLE